MPDVEEIKDQLCPMCHKKTLSLREMEREIPYFGMVYIFSMECSNCDYTIADVETDGENEPEKFSITIETEEDLKARVVKSSQASIIIPRMVTITPGPMSNGYVTNIEGILNRVKKVIEEQKNDDDPQVRKKAKNHLKKLQRVLWGRDKLTLIIKDPTGNSAILIEKAKKQKL